MPLNEFSERKRWNIYVLPETIQRVKALVLNTGANSIGQYLDELIEREAGLGKILSGGGECLASEKSELSVKDGDVLEVDYNIKI